MDTNPRRPRLTDRQQMDRAMQLLRGGRTRNRPLVSEAEQRRDPGLWARRLKDRTEQERRQ